MGGGLAPGQQSAIQYALTVGGKAYYPDELAPDRLAKIKWYLRDGYLPCPASEWTAAGIKVEIQHFANRILDDRLTAVYTRVRLTNTTGSAQKAGLNINAGPAVELPLSGEPARAADGAMYFDFSLQAGASSTWDFVTVSSGDVANVLKVNKVANPGFEDDSPQTGTHVAWKTSGDEDASYTTGWNLTNLPNAEDLQVQAQEYMQVQVQRSGRFQLVHHRASDYKVYTYQTISDLPDGTYEFRAWVRNAGGNGASRLVAKQYGGPDLAAEVRATNTRC